MSQMDYKAAIERILAYATERELQIIYEIALSLTARAGGEDAE